VVKVLFKDNKFKIEGSFDLGYIGLYKNDNINLDVSYDCVIDRIIEEIMSWEAYEKKHGNKKITNNEMAVFLTEHINQFEKKVQKNIKQINDTFLWYIFEFISSTTLFDEFLNYDELIVKEFMSDNYKEFYDKATSLLDGVRDEEFYDTANDGSIEKTDIEDLIRKRLPMINLDAFLDGIISTSIDIGDTITFECGDKFDCSFLCSAYAFIDENLCFCNWDNF